jgi:SAM-dependent methyltransferase
MCARLPGGAQLYKQAQRRFGRLRAAPAGRLATQVEMARWLNRFGTPVSGMSCFEVGTGHIPVVPIGFYLAGARQTVTVDLNRRIDWHLTRQSLDWMASHPVELAALYAEDIVARPVFAERFARLRESKRDPRGFLERAGIHYVAPGDAANSGLDNESVDCHYSVTVLEHIPPDTLREILREAGRLLKPGGVALHFIDPGDHFQHQDKSITPINFLRFSEADWQRLAGNEFSYCNRMRASDLVAMVCGLGFGIARSEAIVDEQSLSALRQGFPVDPQFRGHSADDLCTVSLRLMLTKAIG